MSTVGFLPIIPSKSTADVDDVDGDLPEVFSAAICLPADGEDSPETTSSANDQSDISTDSTDEKDSDNMSATNNLSDDATQSNAASNLESPDLDYSLEFKPRSMSMPLRFLSVSDISTNSMTEGDHLRREQAPSKQQKASVFIDGFKRDGQKPSQYAAALEEKTKGVTLEDIKKGLYIVPHSNLSKGLEMGKEIKGGREKKRKVWGK